jgi:hypothetical protein
MNAFACNHFSVVGVHLSCYLCVISLPSMYTSVLSCTNFI